jgi:hypothetical protein
VATLSLLLPLLLLLLLLLSLHFVPSDSPRAHTHQCSTPTSKHTHPCIPRSAPGGQGVLP